MYRETPEDLAGRRFGRLLTVSINTEQSASKHRRMWNCVCDCGKEVCVELSRLKSGHTNSCGCYMRDRLLQANQKSNTFIMHEDYVEVYDSQHNCFLIDLSDYDYCKQYYWRVNDGGYVVRHFKGKKIRLTRDLLHPSRTEVVDHINHNTLDNRRSNLRIATYSQNNYNTRPKGNNTGVTGVSWEYNGYAVRINQLYLGRYPTLEEAVRVRKQAELQYHAEYRYDPNNDIFNQEIE